MSLKRGIKSYRAWLNRARRREGKANGVIPGYAFPWNVFPFAKSRRAERQRAVVEVAVPAGPKGRST